MTGGTALLIGAAVAGLAATAVAAAWHRRFARVRRELVAFIAREAPEITVRAATPTGLALDILGVRADVDLASLIRRRPPGRSNEAWFAEIVDGARARAPQPTPPPLALVQDRILPMLRTTRYAALFDRYGPAQRLVWRPLDADVAVTYVIAGVHQLTAVTDAARQAWAIGPQALHALALSNLRAHTAHVLTEIGGPRRTYEHLDAFDATRLLVADMLVPGDVAEPRFAIPDETVLLVAPGVEQADLAAAARARHAAAARPLSRSLYRAGPDGPVAV